MSSAVASTSKLSRPKPNKVVSVNKASSSAPPLGKFLASSEKSVRDKAVASLSRFLAGSKKAERGESGEELRLEVGELNWDAEWAPDARLAPHEMAKLWKGIFFCFWMSDKPLVQQALASSLALLTLEVRSKASSGRIARFRSALCYVRGFWEAVVREWAGLDRLRLDKFYLLIRRFVHAGFLLLRREEWDDTAVKEYNAILTGPGGPLHVLDSRIPHSLAYHLADIYLDELESALSAPLAPLPTSPTTPKVPLVALLQPFLLTLALAPSSVLFTRVTENVFTPLFSAALPPKPEPKQKRRKVVEEIVKPKYLVILGGASGLSDAVAPAEKEDVGREVVKAVFEEGGKKETDDTNRRRMYALCRDWEVDEAL